MAGYSLAGLESLSVHDLMRRLQGPTDAQPTVLDVRTQAEWQRGHIEGAMHIHTGDLLDRIDRVPRDRLVAVVCGSGYRASVAASLLKRAGYERVANVLGGMSAWNAAGLPTVKAESGQAAA